ncbi:MAG: ferritin family protein [Deltaproteobacteria bacterium]|nr:ferritin family protein [Deltaproteobacteria bacterium]
MFTFREIIDLAIRIEQNGEKTYRKAQNEVLNPLLTPTLKRLADDEKEHIKWFEEFRDRVGGQAVQSGLEEMGKSLLQGVLGDQAFSIQEADFSKIDDLQTLLELSLEFEKDTILFYEMLSAFVTDQNTIKQLEIIIQEEKNHVRILGEWLNKA